MEFVDGTIESIPLPDSSVDVIISNCVINLALDKAQVLRVAIRVLRFGGRFAVSDIVVRGGMPDQVRRSVERWAGCLCAALEEQEFLNLLGQAGFTDSSIEPTRVHTADDARAFLRDSLLDQGLAEQADGMSVSAFVRAVKPQAG